MSSGMRDHIDPCVVKGNPEPMTTDHQHQALVNDLKWKKFPVLNDGFVCLVDLMGDDSAIVQAARVSYNKDDRDDGERFAAKAKELFPNGGSSPYLNPIDISKSLGHGPGEDLIPSESELVDKAIKADERKLIRYLLRHRHTTPFEMAEIKLLVRVPMDCWRQWIRHRTANVNEYSTRYTEAIDSQQRTDPDQWRSQSKSNKQGSGDFLPENLGEHLSDQEAHLLDFVRDMYQERLDAGVAKEQARKDLPLSTYTEAYWKIDLHNLLHFLGLRMHGHAQKEIRDYATIIGEQIVKPLFPLVWEAFEDYRLGGMFLTRLEQEMIKRTVEKGMLALYDENEYEAKLSWQDLHQDPADKPCRERTECITKLKQLGLIR